MIELAAVVMDQDATVLNYFKESLTCDGTFEKNCKKEFWNKHPIVLQTLFVEKKMYLFIQLIHFLIQRQLFLFDMILPNSLIY